MNAARQQFECGQMFWFDYDGGIIFAIANDGWWRDYPDEWDGQSLSSGWAPPPLGLKIPERGFGYIWDRHSEVKDRLDWAIADEESGQGDCKPHSAGWNITFGTDYVASLVYPESETEPILSPDPPPSPEPGSLSSLHEQANYDMVLLPSADIPLVMWNLSSFLYLNLLSDGRVVGELKRPIEGVDLPSGIEVDKRDGRWIVWFAGEFARGLWAHCLRVAYRPFIAAVDG